MEQIIYLGQDDELTTVLERVELAREREVVFVVPDRAQALKSSVNLKLLQRRAARQNKQLTLVSGDAQLRAVADKLGFVTAPTLEKHQQNVAGGQHTLASPPSSPAAFPQTLSPTAAPAAMKVLPVRARPAPDDTEQDSTPFRPAKPLFSGSAFRSPPAIRIIPSNATAARRPVFPSPGQALRKLLQAPQIRVFLAGLALLSLLFGGLYVYFIFPEAEVVIRPQAQPLTETLHLVASASVKEINWQQKRIPAHLLTFPVSAESAAGVATGHKTIPDGRATGQVTFTNRLAEAVVIPTGVIVQTSSGIRFHTTEAVTVGAATENLTSITFGKATVPVEAVEPGPDSNVDAFQVRQIDPGAGLRTLVVFNLAALTGGTQRTVTIVSRTDLQQAQQRLHSRLQARAAAYFAQQSGPETIYAALPPVERVELDHQAGDITEKFLLTLHLQSQALVVRDSDINDAVSQILTHEVSQTRPGFMLLSSTSKPQRDPAVPLTGTPEVALLAASTGQIAAQIRIADLQEQLAGKNAKAALAYLKTIPNVVSYKLILKPMWAGHLSVLTSRITIRVVPPPPTQ